MERVYDDLREMIEKELDEIVQQGQMDGNTIECVYKMIDILKDIGEIETHDSGYSMYPYAWEGNSYRRGRDSMGRFTSSYDRSMSNRGGYSRGGEREEIMAKMGRMMDGAASETERQAIQRIMNQL